MTDKHGLEHIAQSQGMRLKTFSVTFQGVLIFTRSVFPLDSSFVSFYTIRVQSELFDNLFLHFLLPGQIWP